ncbi:preprotein translocase subunit SecY [Deinococcus humi]|uniref:Protein translocase subunit SecY n=1 Tax=Deinococcus humi TaxID=662880 RepID=A0A7W8JVZ9_9DEIO|nr:preprotein translocase subunit SecY [Deinococcus humi]MBB5364129.1 preprotein translocase subunit SecY [Deinococcus humi]GGO32235.1 protein translocase subunit SecY [Deinococcus humi]
MLRAFRDAFRIPDLQRKIVFTLLLLAVYRLGSAIPTPGVNTAALSNATSGGLFGLISMISGGNLSQFSIFALGVLPYITASIVIQLMTTTIPALEKLSKEGEEGRKKINQFTRYSAVGLGAVQALFFSLFVTSNPAYVAVGWTPGLFTVLVMVLTQVAGIAFTMWIGERITEVGVGNGISLIITAGIIAAYPREIAATAQLFRTDQVQLLSLLAFIAIILVTIAGIVYVYQGERRVPVTYARARGGAPAAAAGSASTGRGAGQATWLPIKVNQAGVIPVIFASAMLIIPNLIASATATRAPGVNAWISSNLVFGQPLYILLEAALIFGFTYLYNSVQFDPKRIAEQLREAGGFIPGVRPGTPTSEYLGSISSRLSLWGAIFLVVLTIIPQIVQRVTGITTFQFSGTGLLIIVGVALETLKQLEAQLTVRRYDGFISKGRIRGRLNN